MEVCPRCGVENKDDRAACWNCFGPLRSGAGDAGHQMPVVHTRRFSLRIPWKPLLAIIVLGGGGYAGYKVMMGRSPASVAQAYMDAVLVGDTEGMQKLSAGGGGSLLPTQLKLDKAEVQADIVTGDDASAQVPVRLSLTPDTSMIRAGVNLAEYAQTLGDAMTALRQQVPTQVMLTKDQGRWKVDESATRRAFGQDLKKKLPEDVLAKLAKIPKQPTRAAVTAAAPGAAQPPYLSSPAMAGGGLRSAGPAATPSAPMGPMWGYSREGEE